MADKLTYWYDDQAEEGHWKGVPNRTTATEDFTVLVLDTGYKILTFGDNQQAGAQVHVLDSSDKEIAMWDNAEWRDDPELVMGAILRAAAGV